MGSIANQGIKSGIYILLGFLVGSISSIFIFPKICSKAELGQFQYFLQWSLVLAQFMSFGAGSIAVRYFPKFKNENRLHVIYFICVLFSSIGSLLFLIFCFFFGDIFLSSIQDELSLSEPFAIIILVSFTIMQVFMKVYSGLAIAMVRTPNNFFINELYIRVAVLICFIFYGLGYFNFTQLFYWLIFAYFTQTILIMLSTGSFRNLKMKAPNKTEFREIGNYGSYALLDSGANVLVNRLDVIMIIYMLGHFANVQEYSMSINLAAFVMLPWRSLVTSATPFISQHFHDKKYDKINELYQKASINLLLFGGFIFIGIFINIDDLIRLIPDNYSAIKYPFLFLGIAKLVDMTSSINNQVLMISPYYRYNLYFNLILVGLTLLANALLIPIYGITGSGIATLIAITLFNMAKGIFLYKKYKFVPFSSKTLISLIGLAVIFIIGFYLPLRIDNVFLSIGIKSLIVTVLFLIFLFVFKPSTDVIQTWNKIKFKIPILKKLY